jgi:serine/threonine-protein kinase
VAEHPRVKAEPSQPAGRPHAAASGASGAAGRKLGILRINTRPWSRVFVDGKLVGNTPQMNISLAAGTHQLKLVNPDFGMTKTLSVQIAAGQTVTKVLTLQP